MLRCQTLPSMWHSAITCSVDYTFISFEMVACYGSYKFILKDRNFHLSLFEREVVTGEACIACSEWSLNLARKKLTTNFLPSVLPRRVSPIWATYAPSDHSDGEPSLTLGQDQPVIPGVPFIRWATALPYRTAGSLTPTFVPVRFVYLTVKLAFAFTLYGWFPNSLSQPSSASVTL